MAGKDLEKVEDAVAVVMGDVEPEPEDSEAIQRLIVGRILSAKTAADIFTDDSTTATKDLLDIPLVITDVRLAKSELEDARPVYMLIECARRDTGEMIVLNSGAAKIMATLYQCKRLGLLPVEASVYEVTKAAKGRSAPLGLRPEGKTLAAIEKARGA